jgi:hypothetical protein
MAAMALLLQKTEGTMQPLTDFIENAEKPTRIILAGGIARFNRPEHKPLIDQLYSFNDPDIDRAIRAGKMTRMKASDDEFWA